MANFTAAEIYDFIDRRRQPSAPAIDGWDYDSYNHYSTPRQPSPVPYAETEADTLALSNAFDSLSVAGSNYTTTASHRTAPSSRHSVMSSKQSSIFSRPNRHGGRRRHNAPSTAPSSRPTQNGHQPSFAQQFAHVPEPTPEAHGNAFMLWCEFCVLKNCDAMFRGDDEEGWIHHHINHLRDHYPRQLVCWFCDDVPFVAERTEDRYANFILRMQHIRGHIFDEHQTRNHMRPDFHVIEHLRRHNLIDNDTFNHAMGYDELPPSLRLPGDDSQADGQPQASRDVGQYIVQEESRRHRRRDRDRDRDPNRRRW
ncbi:hypothetical protein V8F20_001148 [Naviculisporaceae sp. PSN 640]